MPFTPANATIRPPVPRTRPGVIVLAACYAGVVLGAGALAAVNHFGGGR